MVWHLRSARDHVLQRCGQAVGDSPRRGQHNVPVTTRPGGSRTARGQRDRDRPLGPSRQGPGTATEDNGHTDRETRSATGRRRQGREQHQTPPGTPLWDTAQSHGGSVCAWRPCYRILGSPGRRPVALRPTLSRGLPFSGHPRWCGVWQYGTFIGIQERNLRQRAIYSMRRDGECI
jgi:hypothetical protein